LFSEIENVWHRVEPIIAKAVQYSDGKYSTEHVKKSLLSRKMQLWVYVNGDIKSCAVTQISNYPLKNVCTILFAAGADLHEWLRFMPMIEEWARENKCDDIDIYGRPGWEKVLGWERIHVVIRKNLHESSH
jgi:hypothetical protein